MTICCKRCHALRGVFVPAPMLTDPSGRPYEARCDDCNESMAMAQADADFAAWHGSHVPQTDAERGALLLREGRA